MKTFRIEANVLVYAQVKASTKEEAIELYKKQVMSTDGEFLSYGYPRLLLCGDSPANITVDLEPVEVVKEPEVSTVLANLSVRCEKCGWEGLLGDVGGPGCPRCEERLTMRTQ